MRHGSTSLVYFLIVFTTNEVRKSIALKVMDRIRRQQKYRELSTYFTGEGKYFDDFEECTVIFPIFTDICKVTLVAGGYPPSTLIWL